MSRPASRIRGVIASLPFASLLALAGPARADEAPKAIPWVTELPRAFETAKREDRPLMICINARRVGIGRFEPAAKELREHTYRDPRVVEYASRNFVCAFLTAEGTSVDYGELRIRYGIAGEITSPQHIFAYPDGLLILRKEYWPYGTGESSVKALLEMMERAVARDRLRREGTDTPPTDEEPPATTPAEPPGTDAVPSPSTPEGKGPAGAVERAAWIEGQLGHVTGRDATARQSALEELVNADQEGDCLRPLLQRISDPEQDLFVRIEIVRALGRPGLHLAAPVLVKLIEEKDRELRANAAVSLEYIGSPEVCSAIQRRAGREKDVGVASHLWRALGRCGAGDGKVRTALVKAATKAPDYMSSFGPIIGLAYFKGDKRVARAVEKMLAKVGPPRGGRRVRDDQTLHRALLVWCLAEVGDASSADFMVERMIEPLENWDSRWKAGILAFYAAVVKVCRGDEDEMGAVEEGVRPYVIRVEDNPMQDDVRRGRDGGEFIPKADWK